MAEIRGFANEYHFLSNFHLCQMEYDGLSFLCAEAAFQAVKCAKREERARFQECDGREAKRLGRLVTLRRDWKKIKVQVMRDVLRCKFSQNPELLAQLLDTGSDWLVETNRWHDNFWGDCDCPRCQATTGKNQLGLLLMELRDSYLRQGKTPVYTIYTHSAHDYQDSSQVYEDSFYSLDEDRAKLRELAAQEEKSLTARYDASDAGELFWEAYADGEYSAYHVRVKILVSWLPARIEAATPQQGADQLSL